jgi:hypothetical protein
MVEPFPELASEPAIGPLLFPDEDTDEPPVTVPLTLPDDPAPVTVPETVPVEPPPVTVPAILPDVPPTGVETVPPEPFVRMPVTSDALAREVPNTASAAIIAALAIEFLML